MYEKPDEPTLLENIKDEDTRKYISEKFENAEKNNALNDYS
jgi:hypothetical protein